MSVFITFVPSRFQAESFYFKLIIIFNKSLSHVVVKKHTFLNFYVKGTPILFANQVGGKKLKLFLNEQLLCWFNLETLSHRCSNSPVSCIRFNYASHIVVDWYNDAKKKSILLKYLCQFEIIFPKVFIFLLVRKIIVVIVLYGCFVKHWQKEESDIQKENVTNHETSSETKLEKL